MEHRLIRAAKEAREIARGGGLPNVPLGTPSWCIPGRVEWCEPGAPVTPYVVTDPAIRLDRRGLPIFRVKAKSRPVSDTSHVISELQSGEWELVDGPAW
jgi:hypothetical protein